MSISVRTHKIAKVVNRRDFLRTAAGLAVATNTAGCAPSLLTSRPGAAASTALTASAIRAAITEAYNKYKDVQDGANASYIPALAQAPRDLFGIAVVTTDGQVFEMGDTQKRAMSIPGSVR